MVKSSHEKKIFYASVINKGSPRDSSESNLVNPI